MPKDSTPNAVHGPFYCVLRRDKCRVDCQFFSAGEEQVDDDTPDEDIPDDSCVLADALGAVIDLAGIIGDGAENIAAAVPAFFRPESTSAPATGNNDPLAEAELTLMMQPPGNE